MSTHHDGGSFSPRASDTRGQQLRFELREAPAVRTLGWSILGLIALNVVAAVAQQLGDGYGTVGVIDSLDLNAEQSVPAWFTSMLLASASLGAFHVGGVATKHNWRWRLLGSLLLVASVDEIVAGHERLNDPVREAMNSSGLFHTAWVIPAIGAGVALLPALFPLLTALPRGFRNRFLLGAVLYLGGAVGIEMVGSGLVVDRMGVGLLSELLVIVEESCEIAGAGFTALTMLRYLGSIQTQQVTGHQRRELAEHVRS